MNNARLALITGVTGQDGSYLAELLLSKGYKVVGLVRRSSTNTHERIEHLSENRSFSVVESDLTDPSSIFHLVSRYKPDELYNLAAMSHVATSFEQPVTTFGVNTVGVASYLEAIRRFSPHTKFYQASTSEMFGSNYSLLYDKTACPNEENCGCCGPKKVQNETTELSPNSPYAISKVAAHQMIGLYRKSYNLFCSCGILFNHESERRGELFVTKKITKYVAQLHHYRNSLDSLKDITTGAEYPKLMLGNLDAQRDWGYAPDYVEAMWMMLQRDKPEDYVIGTGVAHSVRDFLDAAFAHIGIKDWSKYVGIDPKFYRPCEVEFLCADTTKANTVLGWKPKTQFNELVEKMVDYDVQRLQ